MDQVLVAFESEKTCRRIREILECSGTASCLVCRSGDQVRRLVNKRHIAAVVCGCKLADETAAAVLGGLVQMGREAERALSRRDGAERALIERAKALLMTRNAMTEEEAHHFLQKKSMDQGAKLVQVARQVLETP